jgi:hypothetical protein
VGPPSSPDDPYKSTYSLFDDDSYEQYQNKIHYPLPHVGVFRLKITAFVESRDPVVEISKGYPLYDPVPIIQAVIIGVSNYDLKSSISPLLHSDEDARSFDKFLKALFPSSVHAVLLTSDDKYNRPTPENIVKALTAVKLETTLCSTDWFIFYFSGHGIVGSNSRINGRDKSVTQHFISTVSLDPKKLSKTALPIESLLGDIRSISAGNKLVVLDSCFSGGSIGYARPYGSGNSAKSARIQHASKVVYVDNDSFIDPYDIESVSSGKLSSDLLAFKDIPAWEQRSNRHVLYLAAAAANQEAAEGYGDYTPQGALEFVFSEAETEAQKTKGHGLYTYVLLWNLLSQLPKGSAVPAVFVDHLPEAQSNLGCTINFLAGHQDGASDIHKLQLRLGKYNLQEPEVAGFTEDKPPPLTCELNPGTDVKNDAPD